MPKNAGHRDADENSGQQGEACDRKQGDARGLSSSRNANAFATGPNSVPMPPSATITTDSPEVVHARYEGDTYTVRFAGSTPATYGELVGFLPKKFIHLFRA